jgi:RND family efflux transporter MFP subunit
LLLIPQVDAADTMILTGLTEAVRDSELGLSTTGRVVSVLVQQGDRVSEGDLLLRLDQDLEILETQRRELIWKSRVEIKSIENQIATLTKQLRMTRDLFEKTNSVPREQLENKELELAFAVADLERLKVSEQREGIEYKTAVRQLEKRNLYAPFDGWIVDVMIEVGENCEIDTPLIHLVDASQVYFVANVEPENIADLTLNQMAEVSVQQGKQDYSVKAELVYISPQIDPASGLRTIKALMANPDGAIVPGVAGTLSIDSSDNQGDGSTQVDSGLK